MKKYWIIVDGKPTGPFTPNELKVRRDFTAALPVWCVDLPDWTTVGQLPELACLLSDEEPQQQQQTSHTYTRQQPQQPAQSRTVEYLSNDGRPNSYIGWNIFTLLCCCMPCGLIGIIYGSMVNRRWLSGDAEGARKASSIAAWCIIIGIVAGLVTIPFQFIYLL